MTKPMMCNLCNQTYPHEHGPRAPEECYYDYHKECAAAAWHIKEVARLRSLEEEHVRQIAVLERECVRLKSVKWIGDPNSGGSIDQKCWRCGGPFHGHVCTTSPDEPPCESQKEGAAEQPLKPDTLA